MSENRGEGIIIMSLIDEMQADRFKGQPLVADLKTGAP